MHEFVINVQNETTKLYDQLNIILYILGLQGIWVDEIKLSRRFHVFFKVVTFILHIMCGMFAGLQFFAIFTQNSLNSQQKSDVIVIGISNPMAYIFCINFIRNRNEIKDLFYHLAVVLKIYYNDVEIEKSMVNKIKSYLSTYVFASITILVSNGIIAFFQTINSDEPFLGIITAWPDKTDTSKTASYARIGFYLFWCIHFFRISTVFAVIVCILISIKYQYKFLCSYFESLNKIFDDETSSHEVKEAEFENAFCNGIKIHTQIIWCVRRCQIMCRTVFSANIMLDTFVLVILMLAMVNSENDFYGLCSQMSSVLVTVVLMAFFMWTAGDINVQASQLPDAIYGSGWYNCRGKSSARIRSLVTISMNKAQQPILMWALGFVELSHKNFVAIIKSAYSVFSVFY
uniref:Odorant receptor n=2 Tax=Bombyx mori TaxID=7091 RepID=A7E3G2_BOMMO|nr:TPA_exp: odorant receptor 19 [Bombyx mori]